MIYGYCRISTPKQSIERQIRNIKARYPAANIIQETYSGRKVYGRKELNKLLKAVKKGDTIVFDSVSRMSRNATEGFALYKDLYEKGINLVFLKEAHINTETYKNAIDNKTITTNISTDDEATDRLISGIFDSINTYILQLAEKQILLAFEQSEKEVTDLRQRTKEGLETAKLQGKRVGLPKGSTINIKKKEPIKKLIQKYSKDFLGTNKDKEVIAIINSTSYTDKNGDTRTYHISNNTFYKYKKEILSDLEDEQMKGE